MTIGSCGGAVSSQRRTLIDSGLVPLCPVAPGPVPGGSRPIAGHKGRDYESGSRPIAGPKGRGYQKEPLTAKIEVSIYPFWESGSSDADRQFCQ